MAVWSLLPGKHELSCFLNTSRHLVVHRNVPCHTFFHHHITSAEASIRLHLDMASMLLRLSFVLILMTSAILAKPISIADPNPTSIYKGIVQRRIGCHDRYNSNYEMITFYDEKSPKFDFAIITRYRTFYPHLLRYALQAERYQLTPLKSDEECGWWKADSVRGQIGLDSTNHRGDIYWKYSDLRWVSTSNNFNESPHWNASSESHIPPRVGELPNKADLEAIAHILKINQPAGDIYQVSTILLGYASGFMASILLLLSIKYCAESRIQAKRDNPTPQIQELELAPLSNDPSPSRYTATPDVTKPIPNHTTSQVVATSSLHNSHSEPLPPYSIKASGNVQTVTNYG